VLISADKKCWPEPANSAECDDVPQSPLPAQAYGEQTDTGGWGETVRRRACLGGSLLLEVVLELTHAYVVALPPLTVVDAHRRRRQSSTGRAGPTAGRSSVWPRSSSRCTAT